MDTIKITEVDITHLHAQGIEQKPVNYETAMELMTCLQLIECSVSYIHVDRVDEIFTLLPKLCLLLKHPLKAVNTLLLLLFNMEYCLGKNKMKSQLIFYISDSSYGCTLSRCVGCNQFIACYGSDRTGMHSHVTSNRKHNLSSGCN